MYFVSVPIKNLARRPTRTMLTGLGVAVAVASLIMLVGLARGLEDAWSQSLMDRGVHILVSQKGAVEVLAGVVDEAMAPRLALTPGVAKAAGELVALTALSNGATILASGWEPGSYLWDSLNLVEGRLPADDREVVLGESLAASTGSKPGDTLEVMGQNFKVAGISRNQSALSQGTVFTPLRPLQQLVGKKGMVTFINLQLPAGTDQERVAALTEQLSAAYPSLKLLPTNEVTRQNRILGIFRSMAWGTSLLAIIISTVFVLNTMVMSVSERTKEIGILTAVGWSPTRIIAMVLLEGILLCLGGGLVGVALGVAGLDVLTSYSELKTFIQPRLTGGFLLMAAVSAVLLGALGSLYPASRAVRLRAAQALKRE
ncbi:MAG: ABC transporter permease [Desulfarculaceae bacterium]|nr:ABC transporter permease [Desulfarculaceae bacterium]MCF8074507.1 ABC transporter permease [Desulfarculaceae bacterium]MCF8103581.1 ABC transporter permease [Desulfarculaceae bacterium]MCF8118371.1 ABC transporter permease [Desulfarculaceae bacterium]